MISIRRRLIFWLIKSYVKKWRKTILFSFIIGLLLFFLSYRLIGFLTQRGLFISSETIGMVGSYNIDNLPSDILYKISDGLTSVSNDGSVKPDLASSWKIENNGKTYIFYLRRNIYFSDRTKFTSYLVNYGFSGVSVERPNKYTIVFKLKDNYAPFLVTVSRPIFRKGFVGVGKYKISKVNLNGTFVDSIELKRKNGNDKLRYQFYPTEDSLKTSFVLGELSKAIGLDSDYFNNIPFTSFKSVKVKRKLDEQRLVTLFYNTQDKFLSERRLREAISYAIPDSFPDGKRNMSPLPFYSWASQEEIIFRHQDLTHAKILLSGSQNKNGKGEISLVIKTIPQYINTAKIISENLKKINIKTSIQVVDSVPSSFQIFLGDFNLSKDPDQYMLWHSSQPSNITGYKNLRIDKLLEDGRKTTDIKKRGKIYADFQKYLIDDPPASFLYLPYIYEVSRK